MYNAQKDVIFNRKDIGTNHFPTFNAHIITV